MITIIIWSVGLIFSAGAIYNKLRQLQRDLNGLGSKMRNSDGRAERRWKHMIATQIETSTGLNEAKQHAKLLREDAWRD
jgi:hypothetical protein